MVKKLYKTKPYYSSLNQDEIWELSDSKGSLFKESINVFYHKKFNILSLKNNSYETFDLNAKKIFDSRKKLFLNKKDHIEFCPVCNSTEINDNKIKIFNANYVQCQNCSHNYVKNRLSSKDLIDFYKNSKSYQSTYTNKEQIIKRISEIYEPKLNWVLNSFKEKFGKRPNKILDVGTGSGHFVKLCHDKGISCDGIEVSKSGIDFAKKNFNIDLYNKDIIKEWKFFRDNDYDLITCWGLIEHVTHPLELLNTISKILNNKKSMLTGSVPRLNSLSSFIQKLFPEKVIRHLDPLGHIQMFTDLSLSSLIHDSNFKLNSVWYFGMDAYEFLMQLASLSKNDILLNKKIIDELQLFMDINSLSDSIIFTAVNNFNEK